MKNCFKFDWNVVFILIVWYKVGKVEVDFKIVFMLFLFMFEVLMWLFKIFFFFFMVGVNDFLFRFIIE